MLTQLLERIGISAAAGLFSHAIGTILYHVIGIADMTSKTIHNVAFVVVGGKERIRYRSFMPQRYICQ